jgi:hypothetical protein
MQVLQCVSERREKGKGKGQCREKYVQEERGEKKDRREKREEREGGKEKRRKEREGEKIRMAVHTCVIRIDGKIGQRGDNTNTKIIPLSSSLLSCKIITLRGNDNLNKNYLIFYKKW